ncbi:LacI family transcriptional regulator [bacterium C-53]|nr:LacI family transcriptional regulator [Lachnospiraceae bacterium]NBI03732.1 LacI family transcriptional regulator [Lachnospiraceae bacterium]RKJ09287.1 LacI family transcriptional regulator [bacterium C-53]
MDKKKVTFDDIAKYTNFSKTTISRYFNNPDSLTVENQDIIAQALIDLGYQKNKLAKVLANGKSEFVGIIVPNLYLHYYAEMLNQILNTYKTFGYKFLVFVSRGSAETEREYIQELLAYKIEGMIILSHAISSSELASYEIPIVTIEREDRYVNSVNTDNYMGAVQATSLLLKNNCDILVHVNSVFPKDVPSYGRIQGFEDTCSANNIRHELILRDLGHSHQEIHKNMSDIYEHLKTAYPKQKKGLFMANDTHANSMLNILFRELGSLSEEYRIIGFDDSPIASQAILPISTVGQQIDKIAYEAMELLVTQMDERKKRRPKPQTERIHKKITPVLIRRETTD